MHAYMQSYTCTLPTVSSLKVDKDKLAQRAADLQASIDQHISKFKVWPSQGEE